MGTDKQSPGLLSAVVDVATDMVKETAHGVADSTRSAIENPAVAMRCAFAGAASIANNPLKFYAGLDASQGWATNLLPSVFKPTEADQKSPACDAGKFVGSGAVMLATGGIAVAGARAVGKKVVTGALGREFAIPAAKSTVGKAVRGVAATGAAIGTQVGVASALSDDPAPVSAPAPEPATP